MFLNDEKTNPIQTEQLTVSSNPKVIAALIADAQRFQTAVLVKRVVGDEVIAKSLCRVSGRRLSKRFGQRSRKLMKYVLCMLESQNLKSCSQSRGSQWCVQGRV